MMKKKKNMIIGLVSLLILAGTIASLSIDGRKDGAAKGKEALGGAAKKVEMPDLELLLSQAVSHLVLEDRKSVV